MLKEMIGSMKFKRSERKRKLGTVLSSSEKVGSC